MKKQQALFMILILSIFSIKTTYSQVLDYQTDHSQVNTLPYDYIKFTNWNNDYQMSYTNEHLFAYYQVEDNKHLSEILLAKWSPDSVELFSYVPFSLRDKNFEMYIVNSYIESKTMHIDYVVTIRNDSIIDYLAANILIYDDSIRSKESTEEMIFDISENLEINLYRCKYTSRDYIPDFKLIKLDKTASYQIQDDGKIVKID